jgi:hypothetical protein
MSWRWGPGGPTGSVNRLVAHEVRAQLHRNPIARRARYPLGQRILRSIMARATFATCLFLYLVLDLAMINVEGMTTLFAPDLANNSKPAAAQATDIIKSVPSYLLGAQIGLLGVISLALALVTLIAQRDDATTDVKVYYHESMFLGIAASSVALSAVLTIQFLWPLQTIYHWLGGGSGSPLFKLALVTVHAGWLIVNMWAVAHFVTITFRFVQRDARERLRELYTANVVVPREMTDRLRHQVYGAAGLGGDRDSPSATFGYALGIGSEPEIESDFASPVALGDVHMSIVHWVLRRWVVRCTAQADEPGQASGPRLWFSPSLDRPLRGRVAWCRRSGGVPLSDLERWALRRAFRFRKVSDAD